VDNREAAQLVTELNATAAGAIRAQLDGAHISFVGGSHGAHSLSITASSRERVMIHWAGYLENNGLRAPWPSLGGKVPERPLQAGDRVLFPSASSSSGYRVGRIERVTRTRVLIAYRFKYQHGQGPESTTWQKIAAVRVVRGLAEKV